MSNGFKFTCGNLDEETAYDKTPYEIGDCETIVIGFSSGTAFSFTHPYLVELNPHITTLGQYTDAQITALTTDPL
jgi:hypothetical protein